MILFNPLTKRDVIRRTYNAIGPTVMSMPRLEYEFDEASNITETTVTQDTVEATVVVND